MSSATTAIDPCSNPIAGVIFSLFFCTILWVSDFVMISVMVSLLLVSFSTYSVKQVFKT